MTATESRVPFGAFLAERRGIRDRRAQARQEMAPERRAARVEQVFAAVPRALRTESQLTYEHVRAVLDAIDALA